MSDIRFQSGLGNVKSVSRQDQNMFGYIALASVTKVYQKHNTVDVKLIRSNNRITGSDATEGRFACRVLCANAGYDSINQISYGIQEPLSVGQTVILTFLDGLKDEPIIIGVMHDVDNPNNILTSSFPLDPINNVEDLKNNRKYLRVLPLQDYFRVDGLGNLEFSLHSKSFMSWSEGLSDACLELGGTDFEDLSEKSPHTGTTLQLPNAYQDEFGNGRDFYTKDKDFLMVFRDSEDDSITTWTKVFASKGTLRLTRDSRDETLSYVELSADGSIKLKRQLDSNKRDSEENLSFSEISISANGDINLTSNSGSSISVKDGNIHLNGTVFVNGVEL